MAPLGYKYNHVTDNAIRAWIDKAMKGEKRVRWNGREILTVLLMNLKWEEER